MRSWRAGIYNISNLSFPIGEGLHRILSYQSYASGDNGRVHTLSFWNMRYREECTTSQNTGDFYFCVQKVDVESTEIINFYF